MLTVGGGGRTPRPLYANADLPKKAPAWYFYSQTWSNYYLYERHHVV